MSEMERDGINAVQFFVFFFLSCHCLRMSIVPYCPRDNVSYDK